MAHEVLAGFESVARDVTLSRELSTDSLQ